MAFSGKQTVVGLSAPQSGVGASEFWSPKPILAFRTWFWGIREKDWWIGLDPPYRPHTYLTGRNGAAWHEKDKVALCLPLFWDQRQAHDVVPDLGCSCGIYAYKSISHIDTVCRNSPNRGWANKLLDKWVGGSIWTEVIGLVELSGRIIEHRHGYRAQRVSVKRLFSFSDDLRLVDDRKILGIIIEQIDYRSWRKDLRRLTDNDVKKTIRKGLFEEEGLE